MFPKSNKAVACESFHRMRRQGASVKPHQPTFCKLQPVTISRRQAIGVATAAVSPSWMTMLAERLAVAGEPSSKSRPKSLLILWCQGGPSQLETFDPHPGSSIGGDVRGIASSIQGIQISEAMPAVAEQLHRACLIRSMISKEGDHERATYHLKTGWRPDPTVVHPSIGSVLCHASPSNLEIPRHISILSSQWPARGGYLGPKFNAFLTGDPQAPVPNLSTQIPNDQLERRYELLSFLEDEFQTGRISGLDQNRTQHRTATQLASAMMSSQQLSAFNVNQESESKLASFGNSPFGRGCLAAVRLLETGVRCVEVELSGWDTHANNHDLQMGNASILDRALAATLIELDERGMFEDTIVVCGGEFGRTPKINVAAGRDHWPHGFSILLAGGSFRRGYVHGGTNANPDKELLQQIGSAPPDLKRWTESPVTIPDLHATLLHALNIDPGEKQMTSIGRPLAWSDGSVVKGLLST